MEVSSHALDQGRVNGVRFACALFTNLSRDHLDYHGSMKNYGAAKARLFGSPGLERAVINLDDAFGRQLLGELRGAGPERIGFGFSEEAGRAARDEGIALVRGDTLEIGESGLRFRVTSPWGDGPVASPMLGRFNAENLLATLAAVMACGIELPEARAGIAALPPVPGRLQQLGGGAQPLVVVDYAHTPDALEKVLTALREIMKTVAGSRLILVFGCGGDRDRGKRPLMGEVASRLADFSFVTSDNPRGEEPPRIIAEVVKGMGPAHRVVEDRAGAIVEAIGSARAGDVVLIAGKGHEDYQEVKGERLPFNDADVARLALAGGAGKGRQ
jgi:UDP-N-acetylmuramoyl-L-alanyl-D-glutamate--2,6-diaminopimelate ligase